MRIVPVTESRAERMRLTPVEAFALHEAGRRLASDRTWWGAEGDSIVRTVILCQHLADDEWQITISNAVGVIVVGDTLQLNVTSKIPESHLLYLFSHSDLFPRFDDERGRGGVQASLWEVIAEWFVRATERVVRHDLIRDYDTVVEELTGVRGQVQAVETAGAYYAGRLGCVCEFDEFSVDTPLNRLLKAATATVVASPRLSRDVRRRARSLLLRMTDVGILRIADVSSRLDRRTVHYADAALLAGHVLRSVGRSITGGETTVWTFLIRTPDVVEAALRRLIQRALPEYTVVKQGLRLHPTTMTLNPDLVFGDGATLAVADVKYKIATDEWKRPDLYQVVTFATAYRVTAAAIVEFEPPDAAALPSLPIGNVRVCHLAWAADGQLSPVDAATSLVASVRIWLDAEAPSAQSAGTDSAEPARPGPTA